MAKLAQSPYPPSQLAVSQDPLIFIERVPKADGEDPRSHCSSRSHIETSEEGPDRVRSNPARIAAGARETVNF
jgi:hypothetical protein